MPPFYPKRITNLQGNVLETKKENNDQITSTHTITWKKENPNNTTEQKEWITVSNAKK